METVTQLIQQVASEIDGQENLVAECRLCVPDLQKIWEKILTHHKADELAASQTFYELGGKIVDNAIKQCDVNLLASLDAEFYRHYIPWRCVPCFETRVMVYKKCVAFKEKWFEILRFIFSYEKLEVFLDLVVAHPPLHEWLKTEGKKENSLVFLPALCNTDVRLYSHLDKHYYPRFWTNFKKGSYCEEISPQVFSSLAERNFTASDSITYLRAVMLQQQISSREEFMFRLMLLRGEFLFSDDSNNNEYIVLGFTHKFLQRVCFCYRRFIADLRYYFPFPLGTIIVQYLV